MDEIILSIINGLDPKCINPEIYGDVYAALSRVYRKFGKENPAGQKSIFKAMDYIRNYKPKQPPRPKTPEFLPSKEELDDAVERAMNGEDITTIDSRLYPFMMNRLLDIKRTASNPSNRDYRLAQQADDAFQACFSSNEKYEIIAKSENTLATLQKKHGDNQQDIEQIADEWNRKIEATRQQMVDAVQKARERDNQEILEFDKQFQTDKIPPKFSKFSTKVHNLIDRLEKLEYLDEMEEFESLKMECDKQIAFEKAEIEKRWIAHLKCERKNLIAEQNRHEQALINSYHNKINSMTKNRDKQIMTMRKAVNHIHKKIENQEKSIALQRAQCCVQPSIVTPRSSRRRPPSHR